MNDGFTYVNTAEGLEELAVWLDGSRLMCLDCEWPSCQTGGGPRATLLQLALLTKSADSHDQYERHVVVVDLLELGHRAPSRLREVLVGALQSEELLKLGHSLTNDASALFRALNLPLEHHGSMTNAVDIRSLVARLFPGNGLKHAGLSTMLSTLTGYILSKDLQCSDWAARPLTPAQLYYAACDAACLVDLFLVAARDRRYGGEEADDDCQRGNDGDYYVLDTDESGTRLIDVRGLSFQAFGQRWRYEGGKWRRVDDCGNEFWRHLPTTTTTKKKKKKKKKKKGKKGAVNNHPDATILPPVVLGEGGVRSFVCDEMCLGLARELRLFGFDCEYIPTRPGQERHVAYRNLVALAEAEDRIILTRDALLFERRLSESTYFVQTDDSKHKQREEVMRVFGCTEVSQLMSRCVSCNGALQQVPHGARLPDWVPDGVRASVDTFWVCNKDNTHVYWQGKQYQRSLERLQGQLEALRMDA